LRPEDIVNAIDICRRKSMVVVLLKFDLRMEIKNCYLYPQVTAIAGISLDSFMAVEKSIKSTHYPLYDIV
jgi:hypothetical protein